LAENVCINLNQHSIEQKENALIDFNQQSTINNQPSTQQKENVSNDFNQQSGFLSVGVMEGLAKKKCIDETNNSIFSNCSFNNISRLRLDQ